MSSDLLILLLMVVVVLAGSALCSGVEAALLSVNPVRLHELASRTKPVAGARTLARLVLPLVGRTVFARRLTRRVLERAGSAVRA